MADIFISYSSKDREKAEQLTELLSSAGLSVWIDKHGIGAATSWSKEIVDAINGCKALLLLLSSTSVISHNVMKEVSLASEKQKKIVPLDLEPVTIPPELEYQLAGIQRTSLSNIDAIIRALGKIGLEATQAPTFTIVKETDSRKSLMILPFEDLSPTADNEWFADGLANEMISKLSVIKSLRLIDWNTSKLFKERKSKTTDLAREFSVRYFIEGQVRKFGDQLKISVTLLDIETGDHLWQDSFRGEMKDIFDIQDDVAEKVVEGMKLHLTKEEQTKLAERGTENDEAYTLTMKAREYNNLHTRESLTLGATMAADAIALDPNYAYAYYVKAYALTELFKSFDRNPDILKEAEELSKQSLVIKADLYASYACLTRVCLLKGEVEKAETFAKEYVRLAPDHFGSWFNFAVFHSATGQKKQTVLHYERALELKPDLLVAYFNICLAAESLGEKEVVQKWAERSLPYFEKHLRYSLDDNLVTQQYGYMLHWAGKLDEARRVLEALAEKTDLDGIVLYNIAGYFADSDHRKESNPAEGLRILRRSIEKGFLDTKQFETWRQMESIKSTPDYMKELEVLLSMANEQHTKIRG